MRITSNKPILYIAALFCCVLLFHTGMAQEKKAKDTKKNKAILRDTLDGKLDFSSFLNDPKGFIPVPLIITEPALGGFGGLLLPMFIKPVKPVPGAGYTPPDITTLLGMYTANNSWLAGAFRMSSLPKLGMKYRVGAVYTSLNLSFYRDLPSIGEKEYQFNLTSSPVLLNVSKKINKKEIYLGLQYV